MAHQLQHKHYAGSSLGSPTAATSSFLDHTANQAPGRPALQELSADDLQNTWHKSPHSSTATPLAKRTIARYGACGEVATPESLADDLYNFHIHSPESDGSPALDRAKTRVASRSNIDCGDPSLPPPYSVIAFSSQTVAERQQALFQQENRAHPASPENFHYTKQLVAATGPGLVQSPPSLTPLSEAEVQQAIYRQEAKQFDWVLSLPCESGSLGQHRGLRRICSLANVADSASQGRKLYFGCNLVHQRSRSGSDLAGQYRALHSYTLIATPLGTTLVGDEDQESQQRLAAGTAFSAQADAATQDAAMAADSLLAPDGVVSTSRSSLSAQSADSPKLARNRSVSRSPSSTVSRIEDTIEELDRLEDQFEAVNSLVRVDRVPSPDKAACTKRRAYPTQARPGPARKPVPGTAPSRTAAAPTKPTQAPRASLGGRATSTIGRAAGRAAAEKTANAAATSNASTSTSKRLSTARPSSLLPPKPPVKSSKPLTVSTFELPGEAVARRLKEQREARIAAAAAAAAAATPTKAKTANRPAAKTATNAGTIGRSARGTKPLAIPTFELPGEAISRRKREEHEARLKQQEEEERKRREFKARPMRVSAVPSTYPRDTITSRARQRISVIGDQPTTVGGNKRLSTVSMASTDRSPSQQLAAAAARGRGANIESPSHTALVSRAPSTSTGSISGRKSTVSTDEVHLQKLRGKNIYNRDKLLAADRDREKREREAAAKQARQEAAERSRALSREWAEKQKRRTSRMVTATSPGE